MHKAAPGPPTPVGSLWAPASALPVERWAAEPTLAAGYPNGEFATNSAGHVSEVSAETSMPGHRAQRAEENFTDCPALGRNFAISRARSRPFSLFRGRVSKYN